MLDCTRLITARVLLHEITESFIQSLERGWIRLFFSRHFGAMNVLPVDEHRVIC